MGSYQATPTLKTELIVWSVVSPMLPTPIYRRLGAIVYDLLLHAALWMIVSGAFTGLVLQGQALAPEHRWILQVTLFPLLVLMSFSFSSYFWLKNQQTLGMQAWRLTMINQKGLRPTLKDVVFRFATVLITLGIGTLWCIFDREKRTLQDIITPTDIRYTP